jgi:acetyltransferase-like isoleucine patch superfamily enzyme
MAIDDSARIMPGADVDERASVGAGTTVWQAGVVREGATLGQRCIIGRGAYVDAGCELGDDVKLQNYALVYAPARLETGVFIGPAAVLTNDTYPRSTTPEGRLKRGDDWTAHGVVVREGAAVGARSVVLGGVTIGRWAMVGAGAVVTRDVPDFALVVGVPARRVGWVGLAGVPLEPTGRDGQWRCPETLQLFSETDEALVPQGLPEEGLAEGR